MNSELPTHRSTRTADIAVRFFAAAKAAVGIDRAVWRTAPGDTIDSVVRRNGYGGDPVFERCSFLLDGRVTDRHAPIDEAAALDVLPPFAGG